MKNLLTHFSKIRGYFSASQGNDVGYDCRLTVVRPSFYCRSTVLKLCSVLAILLTVGVGNAWGATYNLVTDASSLSAGDVILIVSPAGSFKDHGTTYNYGAQALTSTASGNRLASSSVTISSSSITSTTAEEWTLSGSAGSWKISSGNKYLYADAKNKLSTTTTSASALAFGIAISSDMANITVTVGSDACKIQMNAVRSGGSTVTYFALYTSTQKAVYIYKKAVASCTTPPTVTAPSNGSVSLTQATLNCSSGVSVIGSNCTISSYGYVWGTSASPTVSGTGKHEVGTTYTVTGTDFGNYTVTGLTPNTTYYYGAYATNGAGTGYNYNSGGSFTTKALTATRNNSSLGGVPTVVGNVITGSPNSGCTYADPAYTITTGNGSTTVEKAGNTFTVTSSTSTVDVNIQINYAEKGCDEKGGTNVISGSTTSNTLGPVAIYNKYSTRQILYTKTDLDLAVGKKGTIKSIYFDYSGDDMAARKITIYMANSALTALSTSNYVPYSSFTQVYASTTWTCSAGWNEITLDTPFEYNGVGNLVVLIDDNTGSYEFSKYFNTHTANTTTGAQIYKNSDTSPGEDPSTTNWTTYTLSNSRPKTKFCIQEEDMEMYTVSFSTGAGNDGVSPMTEEDYGEGIQLPNGPTPDCADDGWVFAGWSETEYTTEPYVTNVGRLLMPGDYFYPDEDVTLYAVYRKLTTGTSTATYTANSRGNLSVIGAYYSEYWWYHTSTGVEFYINYYGIDNNKFDLYNSKGGANSDGWALIDAHRPITEISLTVTSGTPYASLSSTEPDAGTVTLDGSTITCTGNVTKVVVETSTTQESEVYLSAFTVTYKNCEFFSNPTCCTKHDITLASSGSVTGGTFTSSVNRACATKSVTLTATPSNGGYVFNEWTVEDGSSNDITSTVLGSGHEGDNPATMTMPDYNVNVTAKFSAISGISVQTAPTKTIYLAGETFDPSALVVTATYANGATVDVPYSGNEALFTLLPTTATALTTENASVSITYNGQTTSQSITVYSVTLQALDENGGAIRVGGPAAPTRDGATVTKAANVDNYVYKEWVVSGATLADGANANQKIITDPTGAVTVTVKYYLPRVVKWMVNGEEWKPYTDTSSGTDGTAEVARGAQWKTLTLPTDPNPLNDEGCGDKFIGWTNAEISGQLDKDDDAAAISTLVDSNLLNSANKSGKTKTINANPYIFYAVFADYVE